MPFGTILETSLMKNVRLIARLDVKGPDLIKGINFEGLRKLGDPNQFAVKYFNEGIDEIIYIDCVASLYGRNHLSPMITEATKDVFIPLTVGGGIRSLEDARLILRSGADKVAINTAAVVEAKKIGVNQWEVYTDNGRERTGLDVVDWAKICAGNGAGEILLTSIDQEGTRKGFDIELVSAVSSVVNIPIIASGGMGSPQDLISVVNKGGADGVAMADILHYRRTNIADIRAVAKSNGLGVRRYEYT